MPRVAGVATKTPKRKPVVLDTTEEYKKKFAEKIEPVKQQDCDVPKETKEPTIDTDLSTTCKPDCQPNCKPDCQPNCKPKEKTFKELQALFGTGFTENECREMYDRLMELANNYPMERTAMHKEALVTYVKYAFKRDKAIAEDDIEAADKWGKLASKQANDAKINPNQLSAADLSDGINNFSKISEAVEREQDIIPILPHFKQQPQDVVDYTLWQFVNYIRRLQNLPTVTYAEIYKFMDEMYEKNKSSLRFLQKERNGHYDDFVEDIESAT